MGLQPQCRGQIWGGQEMWNKGQYVFSEANKCTMNLLDIKIRFWIYLMSLWSSLTLESLLRDL